MNIAIIGLTITSSWGNGHATTYRALVRELDALGHGVTFLEHDKPWYASNRDLPDPPFGKTILYADFDTLEREHKELVANADAVVVGSYVPRGVEVGDWALCTARGPVAFYDIDTPVTLAKLRRGDFEYVSPELIPRYAAYLSFSGGPTLDRLEREFGSPMARPLYCSVDPQLYFPQDAKPAYDLSYLGTYSDDRQPTVNQLLIETARKSPGRSFCVAGPQYPAEIAWPANVERIEHLPPAEHRGFYNRSRWALNVTRSDMIAAGWSPSVRLFEAAACGTPVVSDRWDGLGDFFKLGEEIVVADTTANAVEALAMPSDEAEAIGAAARERVMARHTARHRAEELVAYLRELGA